MFNYKINNMIISLFLCQIQYIKGYSTRTPEADNTQFSHQKKPDEIDHANSFFFFFDRFLLVATSRFCCQYTAVIFNFIGAFFLA